MCFRDLAHADLCVFHSFSDKLNNVKINTYNRHEHKLAHESNRRRHRFLHNLLKNLQLHPTTKPETQHNHKHSDHNDKDIIQCSPVMFYGHLNMGRESNRMTIVVIDHSREIRVSKPIRVDVECELLLSNGTIYVVVSVMYDVNDVIIGRDQCDVCWCIPHA